MHDDDRHAGRRRSVGRRHSALLACVAVGVVGLVCVGIALATQRHAPQPAATTATAPRPAPVPTLLPAPSPAQTSPSSTTASATTAAPAETAKAPRVAPISISIPALDVRAGFVDLGVNPDGTIQVPSDVEHAGWYTPGPSPGQPGPAVVVGHVDSAGSGPGVFFRLGAAKAGDRVDITLADGETIEFAVYAVREYAKADFPTLTVYGNTAGAELRLITCGGRFDRATGHYLSNIVVFAREVAR